MLVLQRNSRKHCIIFGVIAIQFNNFLCISAYYSFISFFFWSKSEATSFDSYNKDPSYSCSNSRRLIFSCSSWSIFWSMFLYLSTIFCSLVTSSFSFDIVLRRSSYCLCSCNYWFLRVQFTIRLLEVSSDASQNPSLFIFLLLRSSLSFIKSRRSNLSFAVMLLNNSFIC